MIKTISIFKNIDDPERFKEFYLNVVFPRVHELPGVLYTDVTSVVVLSDKLSEGLEGTQLIIETHFESQEAIFDIFASPEGHELMKLMEENSPGEMNMFLGKQKRFKANSSNQYEEVDERKLLDINLQ
ncbi:hypothetical protein [Shimazuella kribbensis]|uniref:hypothetical protein n=1 Tax=Shimazuella kribbensis TaxID=139808 RepID=UPI00041A8F0D|nr:hypothetical protein [Shimazuella kribbensis]